MGTIFEQMITDFSRQNGENLLETCMRLNPKELKKVPVRYRIIALGFVKKMTLEELNHKLLVAGCERLYARNLMEAGLIYAFAKGLNYSQWKELQQICSACAELHGTKDLFFHGQNIKYSDLKAYVEENSDMKKQKLYTQRVTMLLEDGIRSLPNDQEQFRLFLLQNINQFSDVREKTRYYFCKYLYFYIGQKIDTYVEAVSTGAGVEQALSELLILKGITSLKRKKLSIDEIKSKLEDASISCGNLYDAFNYFYFDYVSSDWMDVLLDYYGGNILELPLEEKYELAKAIKLYHPKWKKLKDEEVILAKWKELQKEEELMDQAYSLDEGGRGYQKNRSGEKSVRNYIKGTVDIDRTTLICYLIFFGKDLHTESNLKITRRRLDQILKECGYGSLREEDELDCFIIRYLGADDPVDYLMESVTRYAFENRNFFLYHMYHASVNNEEQLKRILL